MLIVTITVILLVAFATVLLVAGGYVLFTGSALIYEVWRLATGRITRQQLAEKVAKDKIEKAKKKAAPKNSRNDSPFCVSGTITFHKENDNTADTTV